MKKCQKIKFFFCFNVNQLIFQSEKDVINFLSNTSKYMATKLTNFKPRKDVAVENRSRRDSSMENVRIVQKSLVFVSGLPGSIANLELLKTDDYFGKYGKITKIFINPQQPLRKPCTYQAYVTYSNSLEAAIAIIALNGFNFEEKPLKASYGTTKYCAHFLRGYDCLNADCFYLHEFDKKNQVLNKDTKIIFEQQNQQAIDTIYDNLDEVAEKIVQNGQETSQEGFPSLMEMMEFLIQSNIISEQQLQKLVKKHKELKPPKLTVTISSPPCLKIPSPSPTQNSKLSKSNSFSTVASPYKSQSHGQKKVIEEKQTIQKHKAQIKQIQQKLLKPTKIEKTQRTQKQQKLIVNQIKIEQQNYQNQIQKNFLKHIIRVNEKSKSRMSFAGQVQWPQTHKIKEIIQKHLIISN